MPHTILTLSTRGQGLYEFTHQAEAFVDLDRLPEHHP
ncbi:YjbQ family protein, partial [Rhizobium ruizarguesonis]